MRHGICILPDLTWEQSRPRWILAEEMGFDHAWTYDHLVWGRLPDSRWSGCVPLLSAAAAVTSAIQLGAFVVSPNFRHPVSFSREVETLVDISDGRFLLGLGAGGTPDDVVLGQPELTARQRVDRFQEFVGLLDRTLREDHVDADGEYYRARNMRLGRGPVRDRVPFLLAGNGPRSARFAARHGEAWVTTGQAAETLDDWFAAVGRTVDILDEELSRYPGRRIDRYLSLDASPRNALESVGLFDDMVGRATELGFTDVIVHWPRDTEPYEAPMGVLESIAERGLGQVS
ncbi:MULTISPECIES: LLM class flavin-dependent oxidoreductase [Gordonia]|uniref:LLM class flavin-dependent oxidoreductase n=1 Tax=Gordonia amicalis TaxID=89053 RepID=A0AAE4U0F0_9ACTN|nr:MULTISPECIES: LLM class flavin-dependent oxidoreductase [Gordonia]ATD71993.1 LLM class flavin-dependent oxidoreductase [Gordonia sp. 1D]MBA5848905.1 LLM class flavin-dependent oxidoreductase [Gordonia amicalis]MCZ4580544.1 LLM class flavin-dependent oxidoreductase [Gordonia amicalis]MDV6311314.1 LLM class flavin-dependent oxidoreductase [Gordonia amicalis]MDV7173987.1 LLM class flavin-dependent oxidoreductase [Gordonia amicalis]